MSAPPQGRREMRKHPRAVLELAVTVSDAENRVHGGLRFDASDLSAGGAFLRSDLLFEVDEVLQLEFALTTGRVVQARAKVARVSRLAANERPGMGMQFIDLTAEDRAALEAALALIDSKG